MVEHTHEENDVEPADTLRRELVHVDLAILHTRGEPGVDLTEARVVPAIDSHDRGHPAFHLEGHPAVTGADVENALSMEIVGYRKLGNATFQARKTIYALDLCTVGKLEAVPPTFFGSLRAPMADEIEGVYQRRHGH